MRAPCVLVVEDDPLIRDLLVAELCDAGFLVMAAADARDAVDACRDYSIDILFIDLRWPGHGEGWILAERLREHRPGLRVVCAGQTLVEANPFNRAVSRPFSVADALAAIHALGPKGSPARQAVSPRAPDAGWPQAAPCA